MLTEDMKKIISTSASQGWVLEPDAKRLFALAGLNVPRSVWAKRIEEAVDFSRQNGYPVVCKVVSPKVIHKSEIKGVHVGVESDPMLKETFERLRSIEGSDGILVEEMISGVELIVGAKNDDQFGPVILFGLGGTAVEIYRDVALKMAPLAERDIESMIRCLKARPLLEGYRGREAVNLNELTRMLKTFSDLVMELETNMESIDLNPVMCTSQRCVIADARIILKK